MVTKEESINNYNQSSTSPPPYSSYSYPRDPGYSTYAYQQQTPLPLHGYQPTGQPRAFVIVESDRYSRRGRRIHVEIPTEFESITERHKFIQKVYGLLCLMILLTSILTIVVIFVPRVGIWIRINWLVMILAFTLDIVFIIILCCVSTVNKSYPWNLILLLCLVTTHNYVMAFFCAWFEIEHILIAFGITVAVVGVLTLFAFQVKWDFTGWAPYILIFLLYVCMITVCLIFFWNKILHILLSALIVALMCVIIVYDTQLLLGGKHRYAIAPNDFVFVTVILYLDVCLLFLFILSLMEFSNN